MAHGALAQGGVAGPLTEDGQPLCQSSQQGGRGQNLDPGGSQLQGQRQAIDPPANSGHRRRVVIGEREARRHLLGPRDKEPHGRHARHSRQW